MGAQYRFLRSTAILTDSRQLCQQLDDYNNIPYSRGCHVGSNFAALCVSSLIFSMLIAFMFSAVVHADEIEMLCLINSERTKAGVNPLKYNERLASCARKHSEDMAQRGFFGHRCPDGSTAAGRATKSGYSWSLIGEALHAGSVNAKSVVQSLMNSPSHRSLLLNPNFCEVGIGLAVNQNSKYKSYWTNVFGKRSDVDKCSIVRSGNEACSSNSANEGSSGGGCFIMTMPLPENDDLEMSGVKF